MEAPDSGMGCGTSFLWVQVRPQVVQSSSVIVFIALNFLGTAQPWQHQALCKSHGITKTVYFCTVQTYICFPNDFVINPVPFVAHSRVSGLIQGKKETDHPACCSVCSSIGVLQHWCAPFYQCLQWVLEDAAVLPAAQSFWALRETWDELLPKLRILTLPPCPTPGTPVT